MHRNSWYCSERLTGVAACGDAQIRVVSRCARVVCWEKSWSYIIPGAVRWSAPWGVRILQAVPWVTPRAVPRASNRLMGRPMACAVDSHTPYRLPHEQSHGLSQGVEVP